MLRNSKSMAVGLVFLIWSMAERVEACSCRPNPPVLQALAEADAVFTGRVVSLSRVVSGSRVGIEVEHVYKGSVDARVTVITSPGGGTCGYPFQVNTHYLIYADLNGG
ncbi:unnamed protein product, partial [Phaeothamnion confervicola]